MSAADTVLTFIPVRADAFIRPAQTASVRTSYGIASLLGLAGLIAGVPSVWILLASESSTFGLEGFRDLAQPGMIGAVLCYIIGHRIIARARLTWNTMTQQTLATLRQAAWKKGIWLDVEITDSFPRVLLSRRDRMIALAGHDCVIIPLGAVHDFEMGTAPCPGLWTREQSILKIKLKADLGADSVYVTAGDGITPASKARVHSLKERLIAYRSEMLSAAAESDITAAAQAVADNVVRLPSLRA